MDEVKSNTHDVEIMGGPRDGEILKDFRGTALSVSVKPSVSEWVQDISEEVIPQFRTEQWIIRAHKNGKRYAVHPGLWRWTQKNFKT